MRNAGTRLFWNPRGNETTLEQRPKAFIEVEEREGNNEANTMGITVEAVFAGKANGSKKLMFVAW